ncbi:uncharacterized protein AAG666_008256 isoform 1-T5 [Megaptera novaeangliae]
MFYWKAILYSYCKTAVTCQAFETPGIAMILFQRRAMGSCRGKPGPQEPSHREGSNWPREWRLDVSFSLGSCPPWPSLLSILSMGLDQLDGPGHGCAGTSLLDSWTSTKCTAGLHPGCHQAGLSERNCGARVSWKSLSRGSLTSSLFLAVMTVWVQVHSLIEEMKGEASRQDLVSDIKHWIFQPESSL